MNTTYHIPTVAPQKNRREMRYPTGVPVFAGSPPRPRHASGNLSISLYLSPLHLLTPERLPDPTLKHSLSLVSLVEGRYRSWWRKRTCKKNIQVQGRNHATAPI